MFVNVRYGRRLRIQSIRWEWADFMARQENENQKDSKQEVVEDNDVYLLNSWICIA